MNNIIPRVAAIHDLSGFGRCSLTVIIPVLSSMGIQVCPLPTSILSTHSGGFGEFYFHDFTNSMEDYASHWEKVGIKFDCIYTGFLGSSKQFDTVLELFDKFAVQKGQMIIVDPVMADNGKLYKTYTKEMQEKMVLLVKRANIITPNLTEASFLINEPYIDEPLGSDRMKYFLTKLSDMGPEIVVITGVKLEDGKRANIGYDRAKGIFWKVTYDHIPAQYPGTGDIFTSVLTGSLLLGDSLPMAINRATNFVSQAVATTYSYRAPEREGVVLEKVLSSLKHELIFNKFEIIE